MTIEPTSHPLTSESAEPSLTTITAHALLNLKLPIRQLILSPWLPEKGLAMVVAPRGVGKTFFSLTCAYAIACGGKFLGFSASKPYRVIYIDGEMPATALQDRLLTIAGNSESEMPSPDYFRILAADLSETGLPDLASFEGQNQIDEQIGDAKLIVIDNLSTLVRSGKENEADSWVLVQDWLLRQRRAGRSVLLVHHAGKNGTARGTSKREDILDTMISLRRPSDYQSSQGARFEVHFDKARGFFGDDAEPFEARYDSSGTQSLWRRKDISDADLALVVEATNSGMSLREIEQAYGISKTKAQRLKATAIKQGKLTK